MQRGGKTQFFRDFRVPRLVCAFALLSWGSVFACDSLQDNRRDDNDDNAGTGSANGSGSSGNSGGAQGTVDIEDLGNVAGMGGMNKDQVCASTETSAVLIPTNLLFVVDKSGSMKCNAPPVDEECLLPVKKDDTQPSKWESTQSALVGEDDSTTPGTDETGVIPAMLGTQGLSAGLITFPVDNHCAVLAQGEVTTDVAGLDEAQVAAFTDALNVQPDGETPLAGAAIRGLEVLREKIVDGELEGNSYLVLMTDGVETCQEDALDDLKGYVAQALEGFNIHTFVIGAPGSAASRSLLSEIAHLGGTAASAGCNHGSTTDTVGDCHVDLTSSQDFAGDLGAVFKSIASFTQASCDFDIPPDAFVDPDKVNVEFTPSGGDKENFFLDKRDCETEANGWQYTSEAQEKIVLCGEACERVRDDPNGHVDVVFGCYVSVVH